MKQISTNLLAVLCVMLLLFTACKKNSDFTVEGVVSGADGPDDVSGECRCVDGRVDGLRKTDGGG